MTQRIEFFVPGIPATAGSKRVFLNRKTGRPIVTDDCKRSKDWKATCAAFAIEAYAGPPLTGPLVLCIEFVLKRPKKHFGTGKNAGMLKKDAPKFPTVRPDATKLLRCLEDALTGILWADDSQIVTQVVSKRYAKMPGADVMVEVWGDGCVSKTVRIYAERPTSISDQRAEDLTTMMEKTVEGFDKLSDDYKAKLRTAKHDALMEAADELPNSLEDDGTFSANPETIRLRKLAAAALKGEQ